MWLMADMFIQCYGFTDKFTPKFLIGGGTSINMPDEEGYREGEDDRGRELKERGGREEGRDLNLRWYMED